MQKPRRQAATWRAKVIGCLVALLLLPILPILIPVLGIVFVIFLIKQRLRLRQFYRTYSNCVILVWHSRRGWHDFCVNNLLPAIPANIVCIHDRSPTTATPERLAMREAELANHCIPIARPYLAYVAGRRIQTVSLNSALQSLKGRAKRDNAVQAATAKLVTAAIAEGFQTTPVSSFGISH